MGGDSHRQQVVEAARARGVCPVVRYLVYVHDRVDVEFELYGAERSNEPGQPHPDWAVPVDATADGPDDDETTTTPTTTTNPYPTTTPTNAGHI